MSDLKNKLPLISQALDGQSEIESLRILQELFPGEVVFSTSLGYEDQVISDMIFSNGIPIEVFTLDTGRLFEETQKTLQRTNKRYATQIRTYYPETEAVEELVSKRGHTASTIRSKLAKNVVTSERWSL